MARRLDITNIDLDEVHVTGLGQDTGTTVSLNDNDLRVFGSAQFDATYAGENGVDTANNSFIALGEFRNALVPEYFNTGTDGMSARAGYANVSAYFSGVAQSGYDTMAIFNYVSGSTYNNDFQANATLFGKTDNMLLSRLLNSASFTSSGATPTSGTVTLTIGGNYSSTKGSLGTSFGNYPDFTQSNASALLNTITANASAHFSNTGWTRLSLRPSGGSTLYLNRADAGFTASSHIDPASFATAGTPIYASARYTWTSQNFSTFFGNYNTSISTVGPYNWTVHLE